ncbi:phosphotransferase enzyme family protein [Mucilaginibacter sp. X4EP1]|uniref:phosphotransferase enzyme family protein n=1 Tax=Mucilaginibacter sp. X4EP1 TaxID=2723092 RepID=UPI0021689A81|nr:aminoglycoside phosphotransferase family protein [Mucilaginibacter sp. X4EP1]MCS3813556.1 Ser/Thr protein kinase RdoA (MazF antagonist) [Mucilaginibacter sp. X4EP1]
MLLEDILKNFGLNPAHYQVQPFGPGLINHTYKVSGRDEAYILQQINTNVFKSPQAIADNLSAIQKYFARHYPDYLFAGPIPSVSGDFLVQSIGGDYYRLFPFIKNSHTVNYVSNAKEAFEAAKQFGRFTYLLNDFDADSLKTTLSDFHNLPLRVEQFETALQKANKERLSQALTEINEIHRHRNILEDYKNLIANKEIPLRVIHHDTKISNVLFDDQKNGLCVIDLDTVMPGYFFSDVGDMMRTYLSAANEEEVDLSAISIREEIFNAVCKGYLSEMGRVLTAKEKQWFIYSGEFMIYMQAIRFLADYLNNDSYYGAKYNGHNLNRAKNQLRLLNEYIAAKEKFKQLLALAEK